MKKTLLTSLSIIALTSTVAVSAALANGAKPAAAQTAPSAQRLDLSQLPAGLVVPPALPAAITDPTLLEAWVRLYNYQDPIKLWDGSSLTGRSLAEYLLAHGIPVVWDTGKVCGGGSCSLISCAPGPVGPCNYANTQSGVAPIYVRTAERGDMPALVDTLAHETFHRTQPFGAVPDTRFEEYWAFRIEYHIAPETWLTFGAYDPLDGNHLNLWIRDNGLEPYFQLAEYPASVAALVASQPQASGGAFEGLPAAALGQGNGQ
jgi:hypothetical protein